MLKEKHITYDSTPESTLEWLDSVEEAWKTEGAIVNAGLSLNGHVLVWGVHFPTIAAEGTTRLAGIYHFEFRIPLELLMTSADPRAAKLLELVRSQSLPVDFFKTEFAGGRNSAT